VQDTNWSASEIKSSFDHHKVMFINNLNAALNSMTLKKNEYRSIECLSANTFIFETFFRWQDYDKWQSVQDYQSATENHWEIYLLDKIIKLSKRLLKSKLLQSSNEIKTTANHIKNARYIKSVKLNWSHQVELKDFWKSVELNWEVELKHLSRVEKLDLKTRLENSIWLDKILDRCK